MISVALYQISSLEGYLTNSPSYIQTVTRNSVYAGVQILLFFLRLNYFALLKLGKDYLSYDVWRSQFFSEKFGNTTNQLSW
jgi:hypothetical protein